MQIQGMPEITVEILQILFYVTFNLCRTLFVTANVIFQCFAVLILSAEGGMTVCWCSHQRERAGVYFVCFLTPQMLAVKSNLIGQFLARFRIRARAKKKWIFVESSRH